MKAIQVEKLLNGVMTKFIEEISDDYVKDVMLNHSYITGGCIPSMLLGEFVNDYDLYLTREEDVEKVRNYFIKEHSIEPKFVSDNAISLDNKIQVITKFVGKPKDMVEKFDWAHIKSYFMFGRLTLAPDVYQLIVEKDLIYTGSDYPLSSLLRTRKFIKKGWHVSTKTMLNIVLDVITKIHSINPSNFKAAAVPLYPDDPDSVKVIPKPYPAFDAPGVEELASISEPVFEVDNLIDQLNGVDPLTIQAELLKYTGKFLTIAEIIALL